MSLINEALKRAKEVQGRQSPATAREERPLQPAMPSPAARQRKWVWPLVVFSILLAAGWWLGSTWLGRSEKLASAQLVPTGRTVALDSSRPMADPVPRPGPKVSPSAPAMPIAPIARESVDPRSTSSAVHRADSTGTTQAVTPSARPLELQAIHYRLKKPSVLIRGKTLYLRDEIDGARIVSIGRHSVQLLRNGETNVLTIASAH